MVAHEKRNPAQLFCAVPTQNDLALSSLLFPAQPTQKLGYPQFAEAGDVTVTGAGHFVSGGGKVGVCHAHGVHPGGLGAADGLHGVVKQGAVCGGDAQCGGDLLPAGYFFSVPSSWAKKIRSK